MIRLLVRLVLAFLASGCATSPMSPRIPPDVTAELAPTGALRAAINFGNPVLASKDAVTGAPRGVSVELSRTLAERLAVPLELVTYDAAGKVVDDATTGAWDIAFVAIDPKRAIDMDYSAPYVLIEGAFVVPQDSPIRTNGDVDRDGVRVVAARGSAYDLYLSRELRKATIVHAATSQAVVATMIAQGAEAGAGVRQQLETSARATPGVRLLDGRFMVIEQAMAVPRGRTQGARYVAQFVEEMKASGFVAAALRKNGIDGAVVAPPAAR
jgi:polar amino acid transport system substrate-binding protein